MLRHLGQPGRLDCTQGRRHLGASARAFLDHYDSDGPSQAGRLLLEPWFDLGQRHRLSDRLGHHVPKVRNVILSITDKGKLRQASRNSSGSTAVTLGDLDQIRMVSLRDLTLSNPRLLERLTAGNQALIWVVSRVKFGLS
jgi:hypothetical protein